MTGTILPARIALPPRAARLAAIAAALGLAALAAPAAAQQGKSISGTWDLFWHSPKGSRQSGYMVFRQDGGTLHAQLHGRGQVKVRGTVDGAAFALRGSRMLVSYRIDGRWQGDRMEGAFRAAGIEKRFTGVRRR